ncbi:MAG TPA: rhodanese-like domain-containing protein [Candidatus Binataceae bacterium]|nr:rhodanese-like domain-containing protein [Candidatus Binataceae bacterium]
MRISDESLVIAYDDGNNLFAARLWWALNYYGHRQVLLLDGGWDLWIAEGHEVTNTPASPRSTFFSAQAANAATSNSAGPGRAGSCCAEPSNWITLRFVCAAA